MTRIENEKQTVAQMIKLYCRHKEGNAELCPCCAELLSYSHQRLDHCKFGNRKPTCQQCPIHCYKPDMKERMRTVMRWSGPRMILFHPIAALKHIYRQTIGKQKP